MIRFTASSYLRETTLEAAEDLIGLAADRTRSNATSGARSDPWPASCGRPRGLIDDVGALPGLLVP